MSNHTPLPSPEVLASLVSRVTGTMLGIQFVPDDGDHEIDDLRSRTALLPIPGPRPLTVGLSSDDRGCSTLASAMFSVKPEGADDSMKDDALRELVNMTSGLVKTTLALDQALGLPKVFRSDTVHQMPQPPGQAVVLKARGLGMVLWIYEGILSHVA